VTVVTARSPTPAVLHFKKLIAEIYEPVSGSNRVRKSELYICTYLYQQMQVQNRAGVRVKVGVRAQSVRSLELRAEPYKAAALYA